ncbi:MAG: hypothetical protein JWP02_3930 [Acidimicrobiales bacterium]|nr:hypothetical protein [Acidimicrobiales bacterium]
MAARAAGTATPAPAELEAEADVQLDEGLSFWTRLRSSVALLVLLTAVGTVVALAIGIALFLAELALRHTLR